MSKNDIFRMFMVPMILVLWGALTFVSAYKDWNWFFTHKFTRILMGAFGRPRVRRGYMIAAIVGIAAGLLIAALNVAQGPRPTPETTGRTAPQAETAPVTPSGDRP